MVEFVVLYFGRKVFVAGWIHRYSNYFGAHFKVELILANKYVSF